MNTVYTSKAARARKHVALARQIFNVGASKDLAIVGALNDTGDAAIGDVTITVDGFSTAESAQMTTPVFFNAGEACAGTVGAAGASVGDYLVPVTSGTFTAAELLLARRGSVVHIISNATDYFYTLVSLDDTNMYIQQPLEYAATSADVISILDDTTYCVNAKTETSSAVTSLTFYPPLQKALSDDDPIVIGRGAAYLGSLTQDGSYANELSYTKNTRKNEGGEDADSNTLIDTETLTVNLAENNAYADYLFAGMLLYKSSITSEMREELDPAQAGFTRNRYYNIIIPAVDTTTQFFDDMDSEIGFRRVQYTPDSISKDGIPSNISRAIAAAFTVYAPETAYLTNKSYEGTPLA